MFNKKWRMTITAGKYKFIIGSISYTNMEGTREVKVCKLMCNDKELPEGQAQVEKPEFPGKPKH